MRRSSTLGTAIAALAATVVTYGAPLALADEPPVAVYDSIGAVVPDNVVSLGFEATSTSEFGDLVQLAPGARRLDSVEVLLSSWGCENGSWNIGDCTTTPGATFSHPITLNIYQSTPGVGTGVGALVATVTETFDIPYRPSAAGLPTCADGRWSNGTTCFNGLATPVTFEFPSTPVVPTNLIWTVAYNTTHHGYSPIGELAPCYTEAGGCGYDALNVGAETLTPAPAAGIDLDSDSLVWNTTFAGFYTDGGAGGVGIVRFDTNWSGLRPTARITTVAVAEVETTEVVKITDATWGFLAEGTAGSTGSYVAGPATAPLGTGSAQFTVSAASQSHILGKGMLGGTKLTSITDLAYSSNQPAGSVALALQLNISYSGGTGWQGRLVYEPTYTVGTVPSGWQRWDTLQGKWWASNTTPGGSNGLCAQASPCDWSQVLTNWPNAQIHPTFGAVLFKLGAGPAAFTGNVDHLTIGVDTAGTINIINYDFENTVQCTTTCYVNGTTGNNLNGGTSPADAKLTVAAGVTQVSPGGTVIVAAGTYNEDVDLTKSLTLQGAGIDQSYLVGPAGGQGSTVRVGAADITIEGFTITRAGNALATWVDPTLNSAGIAIQSQGNFAEIRNNKLTGNRTGIDINNSNGNVITDNVIDYNRTGLLFRNQTDGTVMTGNFISNNWTVGVLFLDGSGGTNSPVQSAANSEFSGNAIFGNWFGGVVDRQSGGSLPTPGTTNLKNFSGNWWGTLTPVVTTANSAELGYSTSPIPAGYPGGAATNPGGAPDILGTASANVDFTPLLESGVDLLVAAAGFQGSTTAVTVTAEGAQTGSASRTQEGVDLVDASGTVHVLAGAYTLSTPTLITKSLSLLGPNAGISPNDATTPLTANAARVAEATLAAAAGDGVLRVGAADVTIDGFRFTDPGTAGASNVALIGAGGNYGGEADDIAIVNNVFDGITRIAVYFNGPTTMDGATVDHNRVSNPTRATGCGTPPATAPLACARQLFNLWQTDHVSFQDNVVFAPAANGDRMRVLQIALPNSPSLQNDSPADNFVIAGNTIRNACVFTCISIAANATNVAITGNDIEIDAGNIIQFRQEWLGGRVQIDHNRLIGPNDYSVVVNPVVGTDLTGITLVRNEITGGGIRNQRAETLVAMCNWWGQAAGALGPQNTGPTDLTNPLITSNLDGPCNAPLTVTGVAGNAEVTVSWAAPVPDGSIVTGYVVTASPGGATCTTNGAITCIVTNLVNETPYTFTVVATTATEGNSPPSVASAQVTPVGPPPTGVTGVAGNAQVTVSWVAPTPVGPAITGYTVTAAPGGATCTTNGATTCIVTGLTNGDSYTFTVVATTASSGSSAPSAPTGILIPTDGSPPGALPRDFNPVDPARVFDTRAGLSPGALVTVPKVKVGPGNTLEVQLTDLPGGLVPADDVGAVSLNVTSTRSSANGFITVYPCGTPNTVSNLNFVTGVNSANAVITPVSATGTVCFASSVTTDLVVDVNGWFYTPAGFHPVEPDRVLDTRPGTSPDALLVVPKVKIGPTNILEVQLTDLPGGLVPDTGVGAVSLNVTSSQSAANGFITVYPCGTLNTVSNLNFQAGVNTANAVITPVSPTGTVCFYSSVETHLVVDVNGWFEDPSGFNPVDPARALDTRDGDSPSSLLVVPTAVIGPLNTLEVRLTDLPGGLVPEFGVGALSLNVTATGAGGAGFITVYPCGTLNSVSSLNFVAGVNKANLVLTPVSATGTVCFASSVNTNLVVDVNGWFSDEPVVS